MRIQETCGCGARVTIDEQMTGYANLAAGKWRKQHACTIAPPGPCAHDPGVVWPTGIKPRCELRAGHEGAHECDRGAMGGNSTWGETNPDAPEQRAERAEAELAALRERVRIIEARTKRQATEFVRRAGRARVASDEARALDEAGDALDDVCAGLRAVADAAPCHCGRPVVYGYDGDLTHHRRMCADCDAVRCDAYPMECPHRADLLDDDTTGAASGEGEK